MVAVVASGRTRATSAPVAGSMAAKMSAPAKRLSQRPGGRWPLRHQRWQSQPFWPTWASPMNQRAIRLPGWAAAAAFRRSQSPFW
jgi:hypothetical protein